METSIYGTVQETSVKWKLVFMELFMKRKMEQVFMDLFKKRL